MSSESAYHEGYRRALVDVSRIVEDLDESCRSELGGLLAELTRRAEHAQCASNSSLAAAAAGKQGY